MGRRNSFILGLLFVILVFELIILLPKEVGTSNEPVAAEAPVASVGDKYRQSMDDVYSVEAKPEGKEWELWADKGMQPKDNSEWTIRNVRVKFYASSGVTYIVTGKQGTVAPNEKGIRDISISGDVVTKSSNGHIFKSQNILYDSINKRLKSPTEIEMKSPPDKDGGELLLTGIDLVAEFSTNEIRVAKKVSAKKRIRNNRILQIQAQSAYFSGRSKMARFSGDVTLAVDSMMVTGPEAKFVYDSTMDSLDSVAVAGGIKVTDFDKFATSQSVNLDLKDDKVVFTGSPRVVQNGDEMTGDTITFLEGGKKVQVSNVKAQIDAQTLQSRETSK